MRKHIYARLYALRRPVDAQSHACTVFSSYRLGCMSFFYRFFECVADCSSFSLSSITSWFCITPLGPPNSNADEAESRASHDSVISFACSGDAAPGSKDRTIVLVHRHELGQHLEGILTIQEHQPVNLQQPTSSCPPPSYLEPYRNAQGSSRVTELDTRSTLQVSSRAGNSDAQFLPAASVSSYHSTTPPSRLNRGASDNVSLSSSML